MISVRPIRVESNSKMFKEHCKWLRGEHGTPKCSLHLFPCRNFIFHPILWDYGLPYENAREINPPLINSTAVILNRKPAFTTGWNIMKESHLEGKNLSFCCCRLALPPSNEKLHSAHRLLTRFTHHQAATNLIVRDDLQPWAYSRLRRATGLCREN
jgi:hypothetical protein